MTVATLPKIDGSTVTFIPLEDRGVCGPPLGEPLDCAMPTAGIRLWISGDGRCGPGCGNVARGASAPPYDDEGEFIWLAAGALTCIEEGGLTTRLERR